jgi:hypothetical protein
MLLTGEYLPSINPHFLIPDYLIPDYPITNSTLELH